MNRIDADFERLEPVAVDHALECERVAEWRDKAIEMREGRRLTRSEIGKQNTALLDHRIRFLFDVGAKLTVVGLSRRLETFAMYVKQPAVKRATQSAVFKPAISEIGAAVRTAAADETVAPAVITEDHQIFTEQPTGLTGRLPESSSTSAAGCQ